MARRLISGLLLLLLLALLFPLALTSATPLPAAAAAALSAPGGSSPPSPVPASSCTGVAAADFAWQPDVVEALGLVTFTITPDSWVTQTVVWGLDPTYGNDASLAVDAAGRPHIAFFSSQSLQYAYYDGAAWQFSTVQNGVTDWLHAYASLALDAAGRPRIAFFDNAAANLKYAAWDGTSWQIEIVDQGSSTGRHCSLALDSLDRPHIAYSDGLNGDLKYARHDGTNWQIETVESAGITGLATSLALDSLDRPHISYLDSTNQALKYARYDGSAWQIAVVESAPQAGWHNSLALDAADLPSISYPDSLNSSLKYAHFDGSTWQFQTVDAVRDPGGDTALAVDAAGHPQIAYLNGYDHDLRYAYLTGAEWITETVASSGTVAVALVLDAAGRPHTAYFRAEPWGNLLEYAWRRLPFRPAPTPPLTYTWDLGDGTPAAGEAVVHSYAAPGTYRVTMTATNCVTASVTVTHTVNVQGCRVVSNLDFSWQPPWPRGGDTVTFTASATGATPITYTWAFGDGAFSTGQIASHRYEARGTYAVVLTATNCITATAVTTHTTVVLTPCVSAYDPVFTWQPPMVAAGTPVVFSGLARGTPPITYTWDFGDWTQGSGSPVEHTYTETNRWNVVSMTASNCYGDRAGAILRVPVWMELPCTEPMGARLRVSPLWAGVGEDVRMTATVTGTVWHTWMVDGPPSSARQGALALDPDGRPQISYYEATQGDLRVARSEDNTTLRPTQGSAWVTETVDSAGDVGQYSSLALYTAANRHVTYYDATNGDLKYGWYDGTTWWTGPIDTAGDVGKYTSLALDAAGQPHFSYYDATHGDLRYGFYNGSAWVTETVDNTGDVGLYGSLELDAEGRPHLAYYRKDDADTYTLRYAHHDGTGWVIQDLQWHFNWPGGDPPSADLALDAAGQPHVASRYRYDGPYFCGMMGQCCYPQYPWPPCIVHSYHESLLLDNGELGELYGGGTCSPDCDYPVGSTWRAGDVALDLDAAGRPTVFYVGSEGVIRVYRYDGASWKTSELRPAEYLEASMALDARGLVHAAYSTGDGKVNYAWQEIQPDIPADFHWEFGDGWWQSDGPVVHHTYAQTGTYTVTVQAYSPCGGWKADALAAVVVSTIADQIYLPLVIR